MIVASGPGVVVCGPGPMEVKHRKSLGIKWCFECRRRREFEKHILVPSTDEGRWYGPVPEVVCLHCGTVNGDCFPGWSREWGE